MDPGDGVVVEEICAAASHCEPVPHEGPRLCEAHVVEMAGGAHALRDLAHVRLREPIAQFGLTHEDQQHERIAPRVDVGQEPQRLEPFVRHVLRLVDDEHGPPALRVFAQHEVLKLARQRRSTPVFHRLVERHQDPAVEVALVADDVGQQTDLQVVARGVEERADERRLAGADLARHDCDRRQARDAEGQDVEGAAVLVGPEEVMRIWRQPERPLVQVEELLVHDTLAPIDQPDPVRQKRCGTGQPGIGNNSTAECIRRTASEHWPHNGRARGAVAGGVRPVRPSPRRAPRSGRAPR